MRHITTVFDFYNIPAPPQSVIDRLLDRNLRVVTWQARFHGIEYRFTVTKTAYARLRKNQPIYYKNAGIIYVHSTALATRYRRQFHIADYNDYVTWA